MFVVQMESGIASANVLAAYRCGVRAFRPFAGRRVALSAVVLRDNSGAVLSRDRALVLRYVRRGLRASGGVNVSASGEDLITGRSAQLRRDRAEETTKSLLPCPPTVASRPLHSPYSVREH